MATPSGSAEGLAIRSGPRRHRAPPMGKGVLLVNPPCLYNRVTCSGLVPHVLCAVLLLLRLLKDVSVAWVTMGTGTTESK